MAKRRLTLGLRWFFLLLFAEIALFGIIFLLRGTTTPSGRVDAPPNFSRVQTLNLQSLINAKGFNCPAPPALSYQQRGRGVIIVAVCRQPDGEIRRFEIDLKGRVRPL